LSRNCLLPEIRDLCPMEMSIVDTIDLLYSIYAIGVFVFIAYFAYKLTYGLRTLIGLFIPQLTKSK